MPAHNRNGSRGTGTCCRFSLYCAHYCVHYAHRGLANARSLPGKENNRPECQSELRLTQPRYTQADRIEQVVVLRPTGIPFRKESARINIFIYCYEWSALPPTKVTLDTKRPCDVRLFYANSDGKSLGSAVATAMPCRLPCCRQYATENIFRWVNLCNRVALVPLILIYTVRLPNRHVIRLHHSSSLATVGSIAGRCAVSQSPVWRTITSAAFITALRFRVPALLPQERSAITS